MRAVETTHIHHTASLLTSPTASYAVVTNPCSNSTTNTVQCVPNIITNPSPDSSNIITIGDTNPSPDSPNTRKQVRVGFLLRNKVAKPDALDVSAWSAMCSAQLSLSALNKGKPCWRAINGGCGKEFCSFWHPSADECALLWRASSLGVKFPVFQQGWVDVLHSRVMKSAALSENFCVDWLRGSCGRERCRCSHCGHLAPADIALLKEAALLKMRLPLVAFFSAAALSALLAWRMKAATLPCPDLLASRPCSRGGKCYFSHAPLPVLRRICVRSLFGSCSSKFCTARHVDAPLVGVFKSLAEAGAVFPSVGNDESLQDVAAAAALGPFRFRPFACRQHLLERCQDVNCRLEKNLPRWRALWLWVVAGFPASPRRWSRLLSRCRVRFVSRFLCCFPPQPVPL